MDDNIVIETLSDIPFGMIIQWCVGIAMITALVFAGVVKLFRLFEKYKGKKESMDEIRNQVDSNLKDMETMSNSISCITVALREMLKSEINHKYKYYMSIDGIPEDELDEFISMHSAYNGIGGNCTGDEKFNRAMQLPVIPVSMVKE